MSSQPTSRVAVAARRPRNLAHALVEVLGDRIRDGRLGPGEKLPTEAAIMAEHGVSRTVVREALSKLQAAGLVHTRHGIGTFVVGPGDAAPFRISPEQLATLDDVIALLELRLGLETEAAALAAQRRSEANLRRMRAALEQLTAAVASGRDAVAADFNFHLEIARATQNAHFAELVTALGESMIPRARLAGSGRTSGSASGATAAPALISSDNAEYLRSVNGEHESIFAAIARQDPEAARAAMRMHLTHSRERRRQVRAQPGAARPAARPVAHPVGNAAVRGARRAGAAPATPSTRRRTVVR